MNQKKKLKILIPSMRERDRYIYFKIISENKISFYDLENGIINTILGFYGESGFSKMSFWLIRNLWGEDNCGVIKCNNNSVSKIILGLGLLPRLGDSRIIIDINKISGTIKGLKIK